MAPTLNLEPIHTYIFNATIIDPLMDVLRSLWLMRRAGTSTERDRENTRGGGEKLTKHLAKPHHRLGTNCSPG
jgi:hypothetical protein